MKLKDYRVRWEEVKSVVIRTDSPESAMELAMDFFYDKARTESQDCHEPFVDTTVDDEKVYLDPEYSDDDDIEYEPHCPFCADKLTIKEEA